MSDLRPHERWRRTHRWARRLGRRGVPRLPRWLMERNARRFGLELPWTVGDLDHVFLMHNGRGTVVNPGVRIAGPAIVFHQVTLGTAFRPTGDGAPTLGRWVFVGAGAKVLGPVTIGDAVVVGANTVVTTDVPTGSLAVGNPATIRPLPVADVLDRFHPDLHPDALGLAPPAERA